MKNYRIIGLFFVLVTAVMIGYSKWTVQALANDGRDNQDKLLRDDPPDDFFAGKYVIVGLKPADGMAYKGRADIEVRDGKILLSRTVGRKTATVEGKFYFAGESKKKSLQFNWKDAQGSSEMFCQYGVDLDNYPRLSCVWTDGRKSRKGLPGFESYYPLAPFSK